MCIQTTTYETKIHRRLTDLYRLSGFQTLTGITPHPSRPGAVILHLRRLKKRQHLFLLRNVDATAA